jgi:hypothetical protein
VSDGERSYRLIHVSNGVLAPQATVSAGASGQNLDVEYTLANDGTSHDITATITNNQPQRFEFAELRFLLPKPAYAIEVVGGELKQIDDSGSVTVCYVGVDIPASGSQVVSIQSDAASAAEAVPRPPLSLDPSRPNPFNPTTVLSYHVPRAGSMTLSVFDSRGREIRTLVTGPQPAGRGTVRWDGRNGEGSDVASGLYIAHLSFDGETRSRKIVLLR